MNEEMLKDTIRELLNGIIREEAAKGIKVNTTEKVDTVTGVEEAFDVTKVTMQEQFFVPEPHDREGYMKMKATTTGRLGIWRAGPRHLTRAQVRFWADHAAAQNAVWSEVNEGLIAELGMIPLTTVSADKAEYLKNPNTGRKLSQESAEKVKSYRTTGANVQIVFADGLSSRAIEKNAMDVFPALEQGLKAQGLTSGKPFFVKNGRVGVGDEIGEITDADVIVMLVGERPGLNSTSSMSAYIAYKPTVGMEESRRTVISNIHALGTVPVEAGAQIADLCQSMIKHKMSGVELKLVDEDC